MMILVGVSVLFEGILNLLCGDLHCKKLLKTRNRIS